MAVWPWCPKASWREGLSSDGAAERNQSNLEGMMYKAKKP